MANRAKQKGDRIERQIVQKHKDIGFPCCRVPLSGACGESDEQFSGDIKLDLPEIGTLRAEVKARANGEGFKTLEAWLGNNDLLFLRRDHAEPLVVLPWATYEKLLSKL